MGAIRCLVRRRSYTSHHAALQQLEFHHFIPEIKEVFEEHRTQAKVRVHISHLLYAFATVEFIPFPLNPLGKGEESIQARGNRSHRRRTMGTTKSPF
jgi:hypothetical protein